MRVLLLEDDWIVASEVADRLSHAWPGIEIVSIKNEAEFDRRFQWTELEPPDLAILDVMLEEDERPPDPLGIHKGLRGGIRCLQRLRAAPTLARTPVILYTAVPWYELRSELESEPALSMHLQKGGDPGQLFVYIRSLLLALGKLPSETNRNIWRDIWDATEVKAPGWISFDLKQLIEAWQSRSRH